MIMRHLGILLLSILFFSCKQEGIKVIPTGNGNSTEIKVQTLDYDGNKRGEVTYQVLVYSFADSDGNGVGDFNGITSRLDYFDSLGIAGLWLSPVQPSMSYHGYDVTDYYTVNPKFGTEDDFKNLVAQAHKHNIKIYLDYVLNHSGIENQWFAKAAKGDEKYRDYYIFSSDPQSDIALGNIPMLATQGSGAYSSGEWYENPYANLGAKGRFRFTLDWSDSVSPTIKVEQSSEPAQASNPDASVGKYIYFGDNQLLRLYETSTDVYEIVADFDSSWGFLVRTSSTSWDNGTKYGAPANAVLIFGNTLQLVNNQPSNIVFGNREYYHSNFNTSWFADFNYGEVSAASSSPAFIDLVNSAKKWIDMGVDGFRLDAVKHIYHNSTSDENPRFLKQWYEECNSYYRKTHDSDIFMVGEVLDETRVVAPYYRGLPSLFEFSFWWRLSDALNSGKSSTFVSDIQSYRKQYSLYSQMALPSIKLSNHDEDRAASVLGKSIPKMKQAAAVLFTSAGRPFIYQGEELGYYGTKSGGDEYVRTPVKWEDNTSLAAAGVNGKVDRQMLSTIPSVSLQMSDNQSILSVYKRLARLRNTYVALAEGKMSAHPVYNGSSHPNILAWYLTSSDNQKILCIHNIGSKADSIELSDDLSKPIFLLGTASSSSNGGKSTLTIGENSSLCFLL